LSAGDVLLVLVRTAHLLAAASWVGGALAYAVSGRPAPGAGARPFAWIVRLCTWALILSGVVITVDRLAIAATSPLYLGGLALKVGLAIAMFLLAGSLAPSAAGRLRRALPRRPGSAPAAAEKTSRRLWLTTPYLILELGVAVYVLGAVLAVAYTRSLTQ
jgi:putative copper export protein